MFSDFEKIRQEIVRSSDIPVSKIERISRLTPVQRDIYLHLMYHPDSIVYSLGVSIKLHTELNRELWEKAVSMAVMEEEVTRTRFILYKGEFFQFVVRDCPVYFEFIDLTGPDVHTSDFEEIVREKVFVTYNLDNDPHLFKNFLIRDVDGHYIPLIAVPHLLFDGYSAKLFFERIGTIYEALAESREVCRKKGGSFYDYVEESLISFDTPEIQGYWQNLASHVEPLEFHTEFGKQGKLTSENMVIAGDELRETKDFCEAGKYSIPAYFRALYGILLNRYADPSEDFLIYDVIDGRTKACKEIPGCFYQVLPVLFPKKFFDSDIPISEYFEYVKTFRRNLGPFQNISLLLQKRILKEEKLGFFYNFVNFSRVNICGETINLSLHDLPIENQVHFIINDEDERLALTVHYNEKFFSDGPNFLKRVCSLSRQIISGRGFQELDILLEPEQHKLLIEWNDTEMPFPDDKCIHQLFENQVEQTPKATAVVFEDQQLTYGELNAKANQLAHYLQASGVGPEVLVGICVERSFDMIIGILGILKAGGAYLPLDPGYPQERLEFMLKDSQTPVLLTQEILKDKLPDYKKQKICLDSDWGIISKEKDINPISRVSPANLVYVIYTSGSTGKPKGVLLIHQGLCNLALAQIQLFNVGPDSCIIQFFSFSFDGSIWEIIMAICSGAKLCLGTQESLIPGTTLSQLLNQQAITHVTFPPSALAAMPVEPFPYLQFIIVAGEACPSDLVAKWSKGRCFINAYGPSESTVCATATGCIANNEKLHIGRPIANTQIYILNRNLQPLPIGFPGELHISGAGLARGYLNRPELTKEKFIPNPFSNDPESRLYKTGDLARYLPDGNIEFLGRIDHQVKIRGFRIELGEIEAALTRHSDIRDAAVIVRESKNRDKHLAACIVSDLIPTRRKPYQSICTLETEGTTTEVQTEDLSVKGICLDSVPDDFVESKEVLITLLLPGESEKRQLKGKIRWHDKCKLGIEFDLLPAEEEAVRQSVTHLSDAQKLPKFFRRTVSNRLRTYLKERLPDYMVPAAFIFLDAMPLTPNGKVDRHALIETDTAEESRNQEEYVAPRTPTEKILTAIWSEVLGVEEIGINDNFFKIGGHSLLNVQVINRVREAFQAEISVSTMFEAPTLTALAERIDLICWINQPLRSPSDTDDDIEEFVL